MKRHAKRWIGMALAAVAVAHGCGEVSAQVKTPRFYAHARWWNTPGYEHHPDDYGYIEFTPTGDIPKDVATIVRSELKYVPAPQRMLLSNSIKHTDEILAQFFGEKDFKIGCLGYDYENRPQTPGEEQNDPVSAVKSGAALAKKYHLPFLIAPTSAIADRSGLKIAPYVDIFKPQAKGIQARDFHEAIQHQRALYAKVREIHPAVVLFHDTAIRPKGQTMALNDLVDYYYGVSDMVDGIGVWALPSHKPMFTRYLLTVRPPQTPPAGVRSPRIDTFTASSGSAKVGEAVSFAGTATDPDDGAELLYTWDFGDHKQFGDGNHLVRGDKVNHAYQEAGEYTARLRVTDGRGGRSEKTVKVQVR